MIYTRNYGKPSVGETKYSPPPGYDGNAFPLTEVKLHEAEDDVTSLRRRRGSMPEKTPEPPAEEETELYEEENVRPQNLPEPDFGAEPGNLPPSAKPHHGSLPVFSGGIDAAEELFRSLRGKFGREELIILLVMLLISSEGASLELMLLALLLIAG